MEGRKVDCLHVHFFRRLQAAQGNEGVFRTGGYGRHRRQWVKICFMLSASIKVLMHIDTSMTVSMVCELQYCEPLVAWVLEDKQKERLHWCHTTFWMLL